MSENRTSLAARTAARDAARRKYPERTLARNAVQRALRSGRLVRAEKCERCGVQCKTEASHGDYAQPLAVEWLCRTCHIDKDRPAACPSGHAYTDENSYWHGRNRQCRACREEASRRWWQTRKER